MMAHRRPASREKSALLYDVRPFFIPFGAVMRIIKRWRGERPSAQRP